MACFRKLKSGSWQAVIYAGAVGGKKKYEYITRASRQECKQAANKLETEIAEGKHKTYKNITLGEAMDKHNTTISKAISPTTLSSYRMYAKTSFAALRDIGVRKITADDIQLHYATERSDLSPKTIINEHVYLSAVLNKYLGAKNPCADVKLAQYGGYIAKVFSDTHIEYLLNNIIGEEVEVPVLLALWCGLRRGEIAGLRWQDIDFEKNLITVTQNKVKVDGKNVIKGPKSFAGMRIVHLPEYVANKIKKLPHATDSDYIIDCVPTIITKRFAKFLEKHPRLPKIRFHDLRHTFATTMLTEGVPDLLTAATMGHSTVQMTKRYQHIRTQEKLSAERVVDNYYLSKINDKNHPENQAKNQLRLNKD